MKGKADSGLRTVKLISTPLFLRKPTDPGEINKFFHISKYSAMITYLSHFLYDFRGFEESFPSEEYKI